MAELETETKKSKTTYINIPEAVGVFDTFEAQQAAFYDLRSVGFHHSDISLLGSEDAFREKLGTAYWRASELEDDPRAPRANFVSEEAIGGSPAAVIGTLLARRAGRHHKDYYDNQIRRGGILMWVRTRDKEHQDLAVKIMKAHSGHDVHVHAWSE